MKTPDEIKRVKDDPTCFECNHYEVCQMWSNAGYLHKDNPKKCSHFAGRSSERRKISTLQTIVDEQDKVIQKLEAQVPRWISVEERLPEDQRDILTVNGHGLIRIMGLYHKHGDKWSWVHDERIKHYNDITHWMPLPEPPEEDDHATD